jgi:hypothetical protein
MLLLGALRDQVGRILQATYLKAIPMATMLSTLLEWVKVIHRIKAGSRETIRMIVVFEHLHPPAHLEAILLLCIMANAPLQALLLPQNLQHLIIHI